MNPRRLSVFCIAVIACFPVSPVPASEPAIEGIVIAATTVPSSPVRVVLHIADNGRMEKVSVTHLYRVTTIPARDWPRELNHQLGMIRKEFGKMTPKASVESLGRVGWDEGWGWFNPWKILMRHGFID